MKKILGTTTALLSAAILNPDLYATGTKYTPGTVLTEGGNYSPGTILLNNTDGTRPRISFLPISGSFEGDYTLAQLDENNQQTTILVLTISKGKIINVKTSFEPETDEGISLVKGVWRLNRDQKNPENPKGTKIKPAELAFSLMVNKDFGIPLSLGSGTYFNQQIMDGKPSKLEALKFDLNKRHVYVAYAPMGEVVPASTTAFFFDRKTYGFLDNVPLLEKTAKAIEGYQAFLSQDNMYSVNTADSITFSATPAQRKIFILHLAKTYLKNLLMEPSNLEFLNRFKTMEEADLKELASSLVSWFQEATVSNRRILTKIEKNTFFETIFSALKTLQTELIQIRIKAPKPDIIEIPSGAAKTTEPVKINRVQELRKKFEGGK